MNWKTFFLILILILSAFLRLYRIYDYAEFLGDQGRDALIIRDFLKNGNLFFIGPQTSVGNMYLGPFFYYFVSPSLLLSFFNPVGPAVFISLLGILTCYLIYRFALTWFNPLVALGSALLFAVSPVIVKYTSFSWNPNVMPLFSLLFIFYIWKRRWILASLSFVMCLNSHFLALLLLPPAFLYWLISSKKDFKGTFGAILVFLLSLVPQILFDIRHQGQNIKALLAFFTYRETTVNLKAYKAIPNLIPIYQDITTRLLGATLPTLGIVLSIILPLMFIISLVRRQLKPSHFYLASYVFFGLLGLGLYKQHIYDHYYGSLIPVLLILAVSILGTLLRPFFLSLAIVSIAAISLSQTHLRFPAPNHFRRAQHVADFIQSKTNGQKFNLALITKQNYDTPYRYFLLESTSPLIDVKQEITDQLFVICEPHPDINCQPVNHPEYNIAAFGWSKIDQEWSIEGTTVYRLVHNTQ